MTTLFFRVSRALFLCGALAGLAACGTANEFPALKVTTPDFATRTQTGTQLANLPAAKRPVDVAIYAYSDQTGQQKPADNFSRFSKAVTQGGPAVLVDVLKDVGGSQFFNVIERAGLQNLLNERNLIDQTNLAYRGSEKSNLPPLRFAGIILEGGIIDYDTNTQTGGYGARILGIGASKQYRRDRLTVALRAVSVNTGEVLTSVMTEKTVYSVLVSGDVFRFVSSDEILEIDAGISRNEPVGLAVRQAIELAVYSLIMEGVSDGLWAFADPAAQGRLLADYRRRKASGPVQIPFDEPLNISPEAVSATGQTGVAEAPSDA